MSSYFLVALLLHNQKTATSANRVFQSVWWENWKNKTGSKHWNYLWKTSLQTFAVMKGNRWTNCIIEWRQGICITKQMKTSNHMARQPEVLRIVYFKGVSYYVLSCHESKPEKAKTVCPPTKSCNRFSPMCCTIHIDNLDIGKIIRND